VFTVGPYTFRPAARLLLAPTKGRRVRLTGMESVVLKFLYRTHRRAADRQEMLNEIWGYNTTATMHTLETHIYRLRQKIEADPANPRLLVTEAGGYRLHPERIVTEQAANRAHA
jgi:DNA-binding response OmpR family regulator